MRHSFLALALVTILAPATWGGDNIDLDKLPTAVKVTVEKEKKNGTVESVEKVEAKGGKTNYVAHIKNGDKSTTITIAEDGTVVHDKKKK